MTEFNLDTSGTIWARLHPGEMDEPLTWDTLPNAPFVQGSIRQALEDFHLRNRLSGALAPMTTLEALKPEPPKFSDLSPETLAMFVEDGARRVREYPDPVAAAEDAQLGSDFMENRQAGLWAKQGYPPVTFSINDAGKITHRMTTPSSKEGQ